VFQVPLLHTVETTITNAANNDQTAPRAGRDIFLPRSPAPISAGEEWHYCPAAQRHLDRRGAHDASGNLQIARFEDASCSTPPTHRNHGATPLAPDTYFLRVSGAAGDTQYELRGGEFAERTSSTPRAWCARNPHGARFPTRSSISPAGRPRSSTFPPGGRVDYLIRVTSPKRRSDQYDLTLT
jgi:hypothetical protein